MLSILEEFEMKVGIKITCSQETEPLGTAGQLALVRERLCESDEPFFILNSDVTCRYPLKETIGFHKAHGGEASILVTKVDEPSKYGAVVLDEETGMVMNFVKSPKIFVGNKINAGIYLLNRCILNIIQPRLTSKEREVFPAIANEGNLFAMVITGFWMDIEQPKDYLKGWQLYLDHERRNPPQELSRGPNIIGNVLIDRSTKVGEGCIIGPDVVVGPHCVVESGVRLLSCTLMRGVRVKSSAHVWQHHWMVFNHWRVRSGQQYLSSWEIDASDCDFRTAFGFTVRERGNSPPKTAFGFTMRERGNSPTEECSRLPEVHDRCLPELRWCRWR
ncbi:hypothetical protein NE237_016574 [Protea cynaroides]|uniref:Nucleotidyl transferase domain-containing protein n=1 Tax=Protea cynaroides TaxID=273540 RepID=A0A9Q0HF90_9MAGN|nr:hypothetical protein NE237_016574 [Protea cynaroides]